MSTDAKRYQQELLFALRLRDIPGRRIAEALAEVDSHIAETGEDPYAAFGTPKAYASHLASTLGGYRDAGRLGPLRSLTWIHGVIALTSFAGAWLLIDGLFAVVLGHQGVVGLSPIASAAIGVILLAGLSVGLVVSTSKNADRVMDPRTGQNMAAPLPRWAVAVLCAGPCAILILGYIVSAASR